MFVIDDKFTTNQSKFDSKIHEEDYFSRNTREKLEDFKEKYGRLNQSRVDDSQSKYSKPSGNKQD